MLPYIRIYIYIYLLSNLVSIPTWQIVCNLNYRYYKPFTSRISRVIVPLQTSIVTYLLVLNSRDVPTGTPGYTWLRDPLRPAAVFYVPAWLKGQAKAAT